VQADIEIYRRWIAEFRHIFITHSPYPVGVRWANSKKHLYERIKDYLESHQDMFLEAIVREERVKFKIGKKKYDLLMERKYFHRGNSSLPIFKKDDKRIKIIRKKRFLGLE